jgi:hypothetical protein
VSPTPQANTATIAAVIVVPDHFVRIRLLHIIMCPPWLATLLHPAEILCDPSPDQLDGFRVHDSRSKWRHLDDRMARRHPRHEHALIRLSRADALDDLWGRWDLEVTRVTD